MGNAEVEFVGTAGVTDPPPGHLGRYHASPGRTTEDDPFPVRQPKIEMIVA